MTNMSLSQQRPVFCRLSPMLLLVVYMILPGVDAFFLEKIQNDYAALQRRVTARHILLPPNEQVALALKQKIRNQCLDNDDEDTDAIVAVDADAVKTETTQPFIIDVFEQAARKYSRDNTTNARGGLLGELVPQGYCACPELDQACFETCRLGVVEGPIVSPFGYHLVLVSERTNCFKLDGVNTKLVRSNNGMGELVPSQQVGSLALGQLAKDAVAFAAVAFVGGGLVAEAAAQLADRLPH